MQLLHSLCRVPAPAGNEAALTQFVLNYVHEHQASWEHRPEIVADDRFQD